MTPQRLPASLERNLRAFEKRLFRTETLLLLALGVSGLFAAFLALFLSDRLWSTPVLPRALLALAALACLGGALIIWSRRWLWRRRTTIDLAKLVQQRHDRLGDRLQGILELAGSRDRDNADDMSPALREAAIAQVAKECEAYDFRAAAKRRPAWRASVIVAVLGILVLAIAVLAPRAGAVTWQRLLAPFAELPRYTFVSFEELPQERVVLHGEPFSQEIRLAAQSRWQPNWARVRIGESERQVAIIDGLATIRIESLTAPAELRLQAGDGETSLRLLPVHRPALMELTATITLPAYLEHPARQVTVADRDMAVLSGSQVSFHASTTTPLSAASMQVNDEAPRPATITSHRFQSEPLSILATTAVTLSWEDAHGFAPHRPRQVRVEAEEDQSPRVSFPGRPRSVAVLPGESLPIVALAEDDYGLRQVGLRYTVAPRPGTPAAEDDVPADRPREVVLAQDAPREARIEAAYDFSPATLGIGPGYMITYTAIARDYRPDAAAVESDKYRIFVLSLHEHAQLVRERMSEVQAGIEEIARAEADLLDAKNRMLEAGEEWLAGSEAERQLKQQELEEQANTAELRQLAREAMELMREAMRNGTFDQQALSEWSETLSTMQDIANQDMPRLTETLQQARRQPENRRQELSSAQQQQQEILQKLRDMANEMNESLEGVIARSFAVRLRELAGDEATITVALQQLLGDTIGLAPENLPADAARRLDRQVAAHERIDRYLGELYGDLAGFMQRTTIPTYLQVQELMEEAEVPQGLEEETALIRGNQLGQAIGATRVWNERFTAWANLLDPQSEGDEGGGGGEAPELTEAQMKVILTLLRTLQEEQQIRTNTRTLQRKQESLPTWRDEALALSDRQMQNYDRLGELEELVMSLELKPLFDRVGSAMVDAATFLYEPRTDASTIAAETEAIELLASLISSASQQMSSSNPQMAALMMQMLSMMQGQGAGAGGGGNPGAYDGDPRGDAAGGSAGNGSPERDDNERAGGAWSQQIPLEFRDALEGYYRGLEELPETPPREEVAP